MTNCTKLSALAIFCAHNNRLYEELNKHQLKIIQVEDDLTNLTAKKILKNFNIEKTIDILLGKPQCAIDISNEENIKNYNLFFEINDNNKPITHDHFHFFRFITVIKPKYFIMESPLQYFNTVEGEFLKELFNIFEYKTIIITLNLNHMNSSSSLLIGNNLKRDMEEFSNNSFNNFNYEEQIEFLVNHIKKNLALKKNE